MVPEAPSCMAKAGNVVTDRPVSGNSNKKNQGRLPKKVHKAEREKLKRDHMNELFSELCHTVEPLRQNNGKACILGDTTKLLRDLIGQVESLRKENAALLNESHYVTIEKNELLDENLVLATEIEKLQYELQERRQAKSTQHSDGEPHQPTVPQLVNEALQQPSVMGSLYVIPLQQDLRTCNEEASSVTPPRPTSTISRPQARYPSASDSWPLQLLPRNPVSTHEGIGASNPNGTTNSLEAA